VNFMTKHMETIPQRKFVEEDGNTCTTGFGETLLSVDRWERQLKEAGVIGWVDENYEFRRVPQGKWAFERYATDKSQKPPPITGMTSEQVLEDLRQ
jgi:hypothetical protein